MPAGPVLIASVASVLSDVPLTAVEVRKRLPGLYSSRAVRYALAALVKQDRADRKFSFDNKLPSKYVKKEVVNEQS
jgi:hypothetical protein